MNLCLLTSPWSATLSDLSCPITNKKPESIAIGKLANCSGPDGKNRSTFRSGFLVEKTYKAGVRDDHQLLCFGTDLSQVMQKSLSSGLFAKISLTN